MEYKVFLTEHACDDLKAIYEYVAFKLLAPESAAGIVNGILSTSKTLDKFPNRNPIYHDEPWKSLEVRFVPYKNYIIFYIVND